MSLSPRPPRPVPARTATVAHAAFPRGNRYLTLRDTFGPLFTDEDFADLYSHRGRPAYPPGRLAAVLVLQFMENLSDRQAADAVRARLDWKYLLGLPLTDAGFDSSVLSEFRPRLARSDAGQALFDRLLEPLRVAGHMRGRTRQRTDCTHVLAAVRALNRLELIAETVRAALNELAREDPGWLRRFLQPEHIRRYNAPADEMRLPQSKAGRKKLTNQMGHDGMNLLNAIDSEPRGEHLQALPAVQILRSVWHRHFERIDPPEEDAGTFPDASSSGGDDDPGALRFRDTNELKQAPDTIFSPYDRDARYCVRYRTRWTGYRVHLTETCAPGHPRLITHVDTTGAAAHEARRIGPIHEALAKKGLAPQVHLADAAYVSADAAISARDRYGIHLVGPLIPNASWQSRSSGGIGADAFDIDWQSETVTCPAGATSESWSSSVERGREQIRVRFPKSECTGCALRPRCTKGKKYGRQLTLRPRRQHQIMHQLRVLAESPLYSARQGIEGSISQAVRTCGLRRSRYRGLPKTRLGAWLTGAALNLIRIADWLTGRPVSTTRTAPFLRLLPA